jgi:hypothetical protein
VSAPAGTAPGRKSARETPRRNQKFVGHDDLTTTLDVYTHVMGDCREADYAELLAA